MDHLYAPWRSVYLMDIEREGCLFCDVLASGDDERNLVLERGATWYVIVNRYPYTTGHVMVVCNRHVGGFADLTAEEVAEMGRTIARCERAVGRTYRPDGINVGANLGRSAGAGVVGHLHVHLVPRWQGDTNFMSTIGNARVVSEDLARTYERLREALSAV